MNKYYILLLGLFLFGNVTTTAQFLDTKKELQPFNGYFNFHYSETEGAVYLEVPKRCIETEFLYVHSIRTGFGSNDIGLDRGQLGGQAVVKFIKSGNKILLMQSNLRFRAETDNQLEKKAVNEAFAKSVLFGFGIKETKETHYVIELTPFLLEDAHGIARKLKKQKEGSYAIDGTRSSVWMERTKAFPKNVEFEALLTFKGEATGNTLRSVTPDASALSLIQHHSFVALPDSTYTPRAFDPRSGSISLDYFDYSTPLWEPVKKRLIIRHRLEKKYPTLLVSEAKEPIVYYLDPGTPAPVKSALLEGARWWNDAFTAIGYIDAFQVKMLPADADPMDVRYNVIQWVHRSTRGWSYGASVIDPRTGEIIKGHVSLGSLRIRQDFMIAQALMNKPFAERDDNYTPMLDFALARIRQLSAHEVGHTLGFAHNFAASARNRSSVMDYPHPVLSLTNGTVDFSNAYADGIGDWDKVTVAYSYSAVSDRNEKKELAAIVKNAQENGLRYISDSDARAPSGAHATAHLWDNGDNASLELEDMLTLRAQAIENFSIDNIRTGEPYSVLEDVFVPLYFYHRFQTEAAVKLIGGMEYNYAVKGDGQLVQKVLPKEKQLKALHSLLKTISPATLAIPKDKLVLFPPRAYGYNRNRESFKSNNGVAFDALGAAATASNMTLKLLLNPQRANRLIQQYALDKNNLGFAAVVEVMLESTFEPVSRRGKNLMGDRYKEAIYHTVQFNVLQHLMNVAVSSQSIPQTKAQAMQAIRDISKLINKGSTPFEVFLLSEINSFKQYPEKFKVLNVPKIPDGSPIGSFECIVGG